MAYKEYCLVGIRRHCMICLLFLFPLNNAFLLHSNTYVFNDSHGFDVDTTEILNLYNKYSDLLYSDFEESRSVLQSLTQSIKEMEGEAEYFSIRILSELLKKEYNSGNKSFIDSTLRNLDIILRETDLQNIERYKNLTGYFKYNSKRKVDSTRVMLDKLAESSLLAHDTTNFLFALTNMGISYAIAGDYDIADSIFSVGDSLAMVYEYKIEEAKLKQCLGIVQKNQGQHANALESYKTSLGILEEEGIKDSYPQVLNNLSNLYRELGADSLANIFTEKAVRVARELNHLSVLTISLSNLSTKELQEGNDSLAYQYIRECLSSLKDQNSPYLRGIMLLKLGNIYHARNQNDSALVTYREALNQSEKAGDRMNMASGFFKIAQVYDIQGMRDSAYYYGLKSLEISMDLEIPETIFDPSELIAEIEFERGNLKKAYEHIKNALDFRKVYYDSLIQDKNKSFAIRLELERKEKENQALKLETGLKQAEIEKNELIIHNNRIIQFLLIILGLISIIFTFLSYRAYRRKELYSIELNRKNEQILQANDKLKEEDVFKTRLLSIVSHDIKSPLASVYTLLQLISYGQLENDNRKKAENELLSMVSATLNLTNNLVVWTKSQLTRSTVDLVKINLYKEFQETTEIFKNDLQEKKIELINRLDKTIHVQTDENILRLA